MYLKSRKSRVLPVLVVRSSNLTGQSSFLGPQRYVLAPDLHFPSHLVCSFKFCLNFDTSFLRPVQGLSGTKSFRGEYIEGSFHLHQVPLPLIRLYNSLTPGERTFLNYLLMLKLPHPLAFLLDLAANLLNSIPTDTACIY